MTVFLIIAVCCGLGFLCWLGIIRLAGSYEDRVPERIQEKVYKLAKNFPEIVIDLIVSLVFWGGLGSVLLGLLLYLFGAAEFLPFLEIGRGIVFPLLALFVIHFWSTPERIKAPKPRGRTLRERPGAAPKQTTPSPQGPRGRTIRSYRDIK
jgi:hypothetical protein